MLTLIIIALTVLVSVSAFSNREVFGRLLFNANMIHQCRQWHRFLTHALIHADWIHLGLNMYVLWLFGSMVEEVFMGLFGLVKGEIYFLMLYVISVVASSYPTYLKHKDNIYYNSVGASGAVSAVVFSAILLNPWMELSLLILPIPTPAPVFGALYLVYCWYAAKHSHDNIAHDVHYWGSLFGVLFTVVIYPQSILNFIAAVKDIF